YRGHSQIHGELEIHVLNGHYPDALLDKFRALGIHVEPSSENPTTETVVALPLNVKFFNPGLVKDRGEGQIMQALGGEPQYKNDALIDNHLRSVLFQVPKPGQTGCTIEPVDPNCFTGVNDLAALDIVRAEDHGIPNYNALRQAYGLPRKTSFAAIVGSGPSSENFPRDPLLTPGNEIN